MKRTLGILLAGCLLDLLIGDPHSIPHPVTAIGKLISILEGLLRRIFPKTPSGERMAGGLLWILAVLISTVIPTLLLWGCERLSPVLSFAAESIMCGQILAARSLRDESMKVYAALKAGDIEKARRAVSMIVGRDTRRLDEAGITRAAVETVAENALRTADAGSWGAAAARYKKRLENFSPRPSMSCQPQRGADRVGLRGASRPAACGRRLVSRHPAQKAYHRRSAAGDRKGGHPPYLPADAANIPARTAAFFGSPGAATFLKEEDNCSINGKTRMAEIFTYIPRRWIFLRT